MQDESSVIHVPLSYGDVALIDAADAERVLAFRWRQDKDGYAVRLPKTNGVRRVMFMHRWLLDAPDDMEVHHINENKADNRRSNLALVTHTQNCVNAGPRKSNTSGYKGVSLNKGKYWRAAIRINGKQVNLGHFATAEEAARAYDAAAVSQWGVMAHRNFPE